MQCHTEAGNINTNLKVEVDYILPELSATYVVRWRFHVDDSAEGMYDIILERDI